MAKYHLKDNGDPGICLAKPGSCPKATDSEHFESREAARKASEAKLSKHYGELAAAAVKENQELTLSMGKFDALFRKGILSGARKDDASMELDELRRLLIRAGAREDNDLNLIVDKRTFLQLFEERFNSANTGARELARVRRARDEVLGDS